MDTGNANTVTGPNRGTGSDYEDEYGDEDDTGSSATAGAGSEAGGATAAAGSGVDGATAQAEAGAGGATASAVSGGGAGAVANASASSNSSSAEEGEEGDPSRLQEPLKAGYVMPRPPHCGYRNTTGTRIVGGTESEIGE